MYSSGSLWIEGTTWYDSNGIVIPGLIPKAIPFGGVMVLMSQYLEMKISIYAWSSGPVTLALGQ